MKDSHIIIDSNHHYVFNQIVKYPYINVFAIKYINDFLFVEAYEEVYKCRYNLAQYFQLTCDKWLSDHFYHSCLATSQLVQGDNGYLAAQGHCNVGLAQEERGKEGNAYLHMMRNKK